MLLSKINSLAHLRAAPCNDLHATKQIGRAHV